MADDYYKILGVSRTATAAEIQKAYRELAGRLHPDMNPDDQRAKQKFQELQQAYDTLNDAEKRKLYDAYGPDFEKIQAGGGPGGPQWTWTNRGGEEEGFDEAEFAHIFGGQPGMGGFADFFEQLSGGGRRRRGPAAGAAPRRGADLAHEVEVPFRTAVVGGEIQLAVRRRGGKADTLTVKIPAGIDDGKRIRLRGQGEPGPRGGEPGDLLITVRVESHPFFRRHGNDLEVSLPVTLAEAAMGAKVDVPTPKGTIALKIPPGSSSGRRLRVKNHGVAPADGGPPGDLYAELQIVLPGKIDSASAALIEQLDQQWRLEPRANLAW